MTRLAIVLLALGALDVGGHALAQPAATAQAGSAQDGAASSDGARWAVVVVGLPGDDEHEATFRKLARDYARWLTETLSFEAERVLLVGVDSSNPQAAAGARKEELSAAVERLAANIQPDDVLWYFAIGHANYDGEHAWLHLAGPDVNEAELAELFARIECREQVFWLTHTCSGWFLPALSRPGRVVITATEPDQEVNETEFPQALLNAANQESSVLDGDGDGQVSLAELFAATSTQVAEIFAADRRVPTEHAQLDDDGDGRGTEADRLLAAPASGEAPKRDGLLAAGTALPLRAGSSGPNDSSDSPR